MSAPRVELTIDGRPCTVAAGSTVAVALLEHGVAVFRASVQRDPRGPVCGMGICFECRVTIDGRPHQRACLVPCTAGMSIRTAGGTDG